MKRVKVVIFVLMISLVSSIAVNAASGVSVRVDVPTFSSWSTPVTRTKGTIDEQEVTNLYVSGDVNLAFDVYRSYIGDSANTYEFGTTGDTITFDEALQMQDGTEYSLVVKTVWPKLTKKPASFIWWYN